MGKFIINIPEELHDKLRHKSVDEKRDMKDIILEAIKKAIKK